MDRDQMLKRLAYRACRFSGQQLAAEAASPVGEWTICFLMRWIAGYHLQTMVINDCRVLSAAVLLAVLTGCTPTTKPVASTTKLAVDPDAPTAEDWAVEAKLTTHLPDLRFKRNALSDVLDFIRTKSGLNIVVDWSALERADIHRDAPVTAQLHDIKLSKALELVFKSVEGEDDDHKLVYWIANGNLNISTRAEDHKRAVIRSYDISSLMAGFADRASRLADIEKFITDNAATTSWKDNGGDIGTISEGPGNTILISQTPENHWKVNAVLACLRESQGTTQPAVP